MAEETYPASDRAKALRVNFEGTKVEMAKGAKCQSSWFHVVEQRPF